MNSQRKIARSTETQEQEGGGWKNVLKIVYNTERKGKKKKEEKERKWNGRKINGPASDVHAHQYPWAG